MKIVANAPDGQRTAQPQPTSLRGIQEREERLWMESDVEGKCGIGDGIPGCQQSRLYQQEDGTKSSPKVPKCRRCVEGVVTTIETGGEADLSGRTARTKRALLRSI